MPRKTKEQKTIEKNFKAQKNVLDKIWYTYNHELMRVAYDQKDEIEEDRQEGYGFEADDAINEGRRNFYDDSISSFVRDELKNNMDINYVIRLHKTTAAAVVKNNVLIGKDYTEVYESLDDEKDNRDLKTHYLINVGGLANRANVLDNHVAELTHKTYEGQISPVLETEAKYLGYEDKNLTFGMVFDKLGLTEEEKKQFMEERHLREDDKIWGDEKPLDQGADPGEVDFNLKSIAALRCDLVFRFKYENEGKKEAISKLSGKELDYYNKGSVFRLQEKADFYAPVKSWADNKGKALADNIYKFSSVQQLNKSKAVINSSHSAGVSPETELGNFYRFDLESDDGYLKRIVKGEDVYDVIDDMVSEKKWEENLNHKVKALPENYDSYITLHTGARGGDTKEKMADNLSKTIAAYFLKKNEKPFSKKRIRSIAASIRKIYELDRLSETELREGLRDGDAAHDIFMNRALSLYNVKKEGFNRFAIFMLENDFSTVPDYKYNMVGLDLSQAAKAFAGFYSFYAGTPAADIFRELNVKLNDSFLSPEDDEERMKEGEPWTGEGDNQQLDEAFFRWKGVDKDLLSIRERLAEELKDKEKYPEKSLKRAGLKYAYWVTEQIIERNHAFTPGKSLQNAYDLPLWSITSKFADFSFLTKLSDEEKENLPEDLEYYGFEPAFDQERANHSAEELEKAAEKFGFNEIYDASMRGTDGFNAVNEIYSLEAPDTPERKEIIKNKLLGEIVNVRNEITKAHYLDYKDKDILPIFDDKPKQFEGVAGSADLNNRTFGFDIAKLNRMENYLLSGLPVMGYVSYNDIRFDAEKLRDNVDFYVRHLKDDGNAIERLSAAAHELADKINTLPPRGSSAEEAAAWQNEVRTAIEEVLSAFDNAKKVPLSLIEPDPILSDRDKEQFLEDRERAYNDFYRETSEIGSRMRKLRNNNIDAIMNPEKSFIERQKGIRLGLLRQYRNDIAEAEKELNSLEPKKNNKYFGNELKTALTNAENIFNKGIIASPKELADCVEAVRQEAKSDFERLSGGSEKDRQNAERHIKPILDWAEKNAAYMGNRAKACERKGILADESIEMQLAIAEGRDPILPDAPQNERRASLADNGENEIQRIKIKLNEAVEKKYEELLNSTIHPEPVNIEALKESKEKAVAERVAREKNEAVMSALNRIYPENKELLDAIYAIVISSGDENTKNRIIAAQDKKNVIEGTVDNMEKAGMDRFTEEYPKETGLVLREWNDLHPEVPGKEIPGALNAEAPAEAEEPEAQENAEAEVRPVGAAEAHENAEAGVRPVRAAEAPEWTELRLGLPHEIMGEGNNKVTLDEFLSAARKAGWNDPVGDREVLRLIWNLSYTGGTADVIYDMVHNGLTDKGQILDRMVDSVNERNEYYSGTIEEALEAEVDSLSAIRNEYLPDREAKYIAMNHQVKKEKLPSYREGKGLSRKDRTYNELVSLQNQGKINELALRMEEIGWRYDTTQTYDRHPDTVADYEGLSDYLQEICDNLNNEEAFNPSEHPFLASLIQRISERRAAYMYTSGKEKEDVEKKIKDGEIPDTKSIRNDEKAAAKLANIIVIETREEADRISSQNNIMSFIGMNVEGKIGEDGNDIVHEWLSRQERMGERKYKRDFLSRDFNKDIPSQDYDRINSRGDARNGDNATENSYRVNPGSYKLDEKLFLRLPVKEMLIKADTREKLDALDHSQAVKGEHIAKYKANVQLMADLAATRLKELDRMVPLFGTHTDGKEFREMRRSLEELSNMKDGNEKPQWVDDRLKKLKKAAIAYDETHSSFIKLPGYGKDRLHMSWSLIGFAEGNINKFNELSKDMIGSETPDIQLGGIRDNLKAIERERQARALKSAKEAIKGDAAGDLGKDRSGGRRKTQFEKLKKNGSGTVKKEDFHEKRKSIALAKGRGSLAAEDPIKEK